MTIKNSSTLSQNESGRLPLLARVNKERLPPLRLTRRDREIIQAVWEYRALTTLQIERLFFPSSADLADHDSAESGVRKINTRCQRRLQLLFQYGFLFRDEQPQKLSEGRRPLIYFLDEGGAALLRQQDEEVDWRPEDNDVGHLFLDHLLATNEVRVALMVAVQTQGYEISRWLDDRTLRSRHTRDSVAITGPEGGKKNIAIIPDGYFKLDIEGNVSHCFLEVDRGTVVGRSSRFARRDWSQKILAYNEYVKSGKFEKRYDGRNLRVLT